MKASAIFRDGAWHEVYKDPVTAQGTKTSRRGKQGVMRSDHGGLVARPAANIPQRADALEPVFRNGVILRRHRFADVRARAWP